VTTIREVAEEAGVSQATAARALGGYGSVSPDALSRVQAAADRLHYRPNRVAQALRLGQSRTVGFIPADLENPFFARIARHLGDALEAEGYMLLVSSSDERPDREKKIIETFRAHLLSGVIVAPTTEESAPHLQQLVDDGIPLVLIDRGIAGMAVDCVTVNNERAGFRAVSHLTELGHQRIGIICDNLQIPSTSERFRGYQTALAAHDIPLDPQLIGVAGTSPDDAYDATRRVLALVERPTALFTTDNFMTEGALRGIREAGLRLPDDVSLVGFDDVDPRTLMKPAVTVVAQPIPELSQQAARLLLRRMAGVADPPEQIHLDAQFVVRDSTAAPPTATAPR
jgi:LacI family transcriptional regulator